MSDWMRRLGWLLLAVLTLAGPLWLWPLRDEPPPRRTQPAAAAAPAGGASKVPRSVAPRQALPSAGPEIGTAFPPMLGRRRTADPGSALPAYELSLQVWRGAQSPARGAAVALRDLESGEESALLTDSEGRVRRRWPRPRLLSVRISSPGMASLEDLLHVQRAGVFERSYSLVPADRRLEGTVVDALDGKPLAGARVSVTFQLSVIQFREMHSPLAPRQTNTDSQGRFVIEELPQTTSILTASLPGYFDGSRQMGSKGALATVPLELYPAETYEVLVEDEQGRPIADARVVRPDGSTVTSDGAGRVLIPMIQDLDSMWLRIWAPGYLAARPELRLPLADPRVVLEGAPLWSGRVVSGTGRPVPDVRVAVVDPVGTFPGVRTLTSSAGYFEVRPSESRARWLRVSKEGFPTREIEVFPEFTSNLLIVLQPGGATSARR